MSVKIVNLWGLEMKGEDFLAMGGALGPRVRITKREGEVLEIFVAHPDSKVNDVADMLFVSPSTVNFHLASLYDKFQVNNREDALAKYENLKKMNRIDYK